MTPTDKKIKTLFELLMKLSFQRGSFTLASGKQSDYYMDGRRTTLSAEGAKLIGEILYEWIAPLNVQAVGGLTMGADPIVSAVSLTSALKGNPINGFLIRKEAKGHGTGRQIEGHLNPGDRVVLVEDVMTTGGSFLKAIEAVRNFSPDVEIVALMALVDRNEGGLEALSSLQIPVQTLYPIQAFLSAGTCANPSRDS
jgi:orotate phosphoribosyltransferase